MDILHHLGQAAAMLLLLELLVVLLIFLALAGGLAFGLRWVNGKTDVAFDEVNGFLPRVTSIVCRVTDYIALPVIKASGWAARVGATAGAIKREVRSMRRSPPAAARPVTPPEEQPTESIPLL